MWSHITYIRTDVMAKYCLSEFCQPVVVQVAQIVEKWKFKLEVLGWNSWLGHFLINFEKISAFVNNLYYCVKK